MYWCVMVISLHFTTKWDPSLSSSIFSDIPKVTKINQLIYTLLCKPFPHASLSSVEFSRIFPCLVPLPHALLCLIFCLSPSSAVIFTSPSMFMWGPLFCLSACSFLIVWCRRILDPLGTSPQNSSCFFGFHLLMCMFVLFSESKMLTCNIVMEFFFCSAFHLHMPQQ